MKKHLWLICSVFACGICSCDNGTVEQGKSLVVSSVSLDDEMRLDFGYDSEGRVVSLAMSPEGGTLNVEYSDNKVVVSLSGTGMDGEAYVYNLDSEGRTTGISASGEGMEIQINEFVYENGFLVKVNWAESDENETLVWSDGNLAGISSAYYDVEMEYSDIDNPETNVDLNYIISHGPSTAFGEEFTVGKILRMFGKSSANLKSAEKYEGYADRLQYGFDKYGRVDKAVSTDEKGEVSTFYIEYDD